MICRDLNDSRLDFCALNAALDFQKEKVGELFHCSEFSDLLLDGLNIFGVVPLGMLAHELRGLAVALSRLRAIAAGFEDMS